MNITLVITNVTCTKQKNIRSLNINSGHSDKKHLSSHTAIPELLVNSNEILFPLQNAFSRGAAKDFAGAALVRGMLRDATKL